MAIEKNEKQFLLDKINTLLKRQANFQREIDDLYKQIQLLKVSEKETKGHEAVKEEMRESVKTEVKPVQKPLPEKVSEFVKPKPGFSITAELERFVGENLISKIGIVVLIIGVSIGTKYAIDNNLISPLMRIILGYIVGLVLMGFALRLRKNYMNFSAVLFSGALAIVYFITYAAYIYYSFYSSTLTALLMILITVATVATALFYKRQVIAHIGMVGAYVVPFLLKEPFQQITVLFAYIMVINIGLMILSFIRKWKYINYTAFVATWLIFISWVTSLKYSADQIGTCLFFMSLIFLSFYTIIMVFKLIEREKITADDIVYLILNSALFYVIGYLVIEGNEKGDPFLGLFTLINAVIYVMSAYLINRAQLKSYVLIRFTIALAITFLTLAIPIQLSNEPVAILWAVGALALFWYARTRNSQFYEFFSYAVMFLAFIGIISIWPINYHGTSPLTENYYNPILNFSFPASIFGLASFILIYFLGVKKPWNFNRKEPIYLLYVYFLPSFLLTVAFFTFYNEISAFWENYKIASEFGDNGYLKEPGKSIILYSDIAYFKTLWLVNYSMLYCVIISFFNIRWIKNRRFDLINLGLNVLAILLFLFPSLYSLNEIRDSYLNSVIPVDVNKTINYFGNRYFSYFVFGLLFYATYKYIRSEVLKTDLKHLFEIVFSITLVWLCSSELVNWLDILGSSQSYKLGLSILWGACSLIIIGYGIFKKKKHLRITAIAIFGITLLKLFFYDIAHLDTIPKTIVFVSLGTLLLIISFLYHKYKKFLFDDHTSAG